MVLNGDDRRELFSLLCLLEGHSKSGAKAVFEGLAPEGRVALLVHLRRKKIELEGQQKLPLAGASPPAKAKKVPYTVLLQPEQLEALKAISDRDGAPVSHHIRQAIRLYLRGYKP